MVCFPRHTKFDPKFDPKFGLYHSGITVTSKERNLAKEMKLASCSYFLS